MRKSLPIALSFVTVLAVSEVAARGASPEKVSAEGGCPSITHVPLVSVPRGVPAPISAKVECPTGSVAKVTLYVRVTDVGKPSPTDMSGSGNGVYEATVPLSMIEGVSRFWYYIDARGAPPVAGDAEGIAQTRWHPVTILEHGELAGGGGHRAPYLWLGGLGAAVGAYLIVDNNSGGGGHHDGLSSMNGSPPPTGGGGGGDSGGDGGTGGCTLSGDEYAAAGPSDACSEDDISIFVCNTCPDASIAAAGDWGAMASSSGYNGEGCDPQGSAALTLTRPPNGEPSIGEFSISVRVNGHEIAVIPWPDAGFYDCFR